LWQLNLIAKVGLPLFFCLASLSSFIFYIYHFYLLYLFVSLLPHFFFICSLCLFTHSTCPLALQSHRPLFLSCAFLSNPLTPFAHSSLFGCKTKAAFLVCNHNAIAPLSHPLCAPIAVLFNPFLKTNSV